MDPAALRVAARWTRSLIGGRTPPHLHLELVPPKFRHPLAEALLEAMEEDPHGKTFATTEEEVAAAHELVQLGLARMIGGGRYAFKYKPKETRGHKAEKVTALIREATGLSRGVSESIADAFVRGRDVDGLAVQKSWPIEHGIITGPKGTIALKNLGG